MKDENINISSLKGDIKNLRNTFGAHTNKSKNAAKFFSNFFVTRSWSFWRSHRKGTTKAMAKIERKNIY